MDLRNRSLIQRRLEVAKGMAWLMIGVLASFYGYVQLGLRKELGEKAYRQAVKNRSVPAPRGIIYDRNGHKLVDNRRALHLVIHREDLPTDPEAIAGVARALDLEPEDLGRRIALVRKSAGNRIVTLMDNLDEGGIARAELLRARYPFLSIDIAPRRSYLGSDLAGHVLGYVGEVSPEMMQKAPTKYQVGEIIGRDGFEAAHNADLKGLDGMRRILVNNLGREVARFAETPAKPGRSTYLTLDAGLQQIVREAYGEENGGAVVIDLRDGGILALHSAPSFDPNMFLDRLSPEQVDETWNNPARPMLNRVTKGRYPPGSTYKLFMAMAALDKGILTPETRHVCHGRKDYYGKTFRCDGVHGSVDLVQALAQSCDIYFYELGKVMDVDEIHAAARKFGLLDPTGVDLPHEDPSRVPSREWIRKVRTKNPKWYAGETISVSIGQGANTFTPLGLARFYAMFATHGKLLTPHLLYGHRNEQTGKMDLYQPPAPTLVDIPKDRWAVLDEGLAQVVKSGTAKAINIPGLQICGKTGTSQVSKFVDKAHYQRQAKHLKDHAWFAGYAPRENPQIAFAIVVENAGFGATAAAPIAKKICEYWFQQRPVKPLPPPGERLTEAFHLETRPREEAPPTDKTETKAEAPPVRKEDE